MKSLTDDRFAAAPATAPAASPAPAPDPAGENPYVSIILPCHRSRVTS